MSTNRHAPYRFIPHLAGAAALVSWMIALDQALPRLAAGPLCSTRQDAWSLAGHCPACFPAVVLSLVYLASLVMTHAATEGRGSRNVQV